MKRKRTGGEKYFIFIQVLNLKKLGLKNAEISEQLGLSPATITRIISDPFYHELRAVDNIKTSELSEGVSRRVFHVQAGILGLVERLVEKTKDTDDIELLIKSLNTLSRFCQHNINTEV